MQTAILIFQLIRQMAPHLMRPPPNNFGHVSDARGAFVLRVNVCKGKRYKDKSHTREITPLSERTSLQRRSGMARIVEGFQSFTRTLTRLSTNVTNHNCLCLPAEAGPHLL